MNKIFHTLLKILLAPLFIIIVYIPEQIDNIIFNRYKKKIKIGRKHCIYLVNTLSGKRLGRKILSILKDKDSSAVAVDIINEDYIKIIKDVLAESDKQVFIIICGGDGTFSIMVDKIKHGIKELDRLVFVPMPIGTGNDLSRALNMGAKLNINYIYQFFDKLDSKKSEVVSIDTWRFSIKPTVDNKEANKLTLEKQLLLYMGLGYDAHTVYGFERLREKLPFLFVVSVS